MIVERDCARARVVDPTPDEELWLDEYLTSEAASAYFIRKAGGNGLVRAYSRVGRWFPAGLLASVVRDAPDDGVAVEVRDRRVRPCAPLPVAEWPRPDTFAGARDYQVAALRAVCRAGQGILKLPTGSGKTWIFCLVTQALPCTWLFIVHRQQLLDQTARELEAVTGEVAGRVGDGAWSTARVTVATYQTLDAARKRGDPRAAALLEGAQGVVADEAHVCAADVASSILLAAVNAYWRVGLSATPMARGDKRSVMVVACLGPVVYEEDVQDLIDDGVLARPTVRMVHHDHDPAAVAKLGPAPKPHAVHAALVYRNPARNRLVVELVVAADKPCLVFVEKPAHALRLRKMLGQAGLAVEVLHGGHSTRRRADACRRLDGAFIDAVIATRILREGVDVPSLASGVNAAAGASVIQALQGLGRGLRTDGGKKLAFTWWDVEDRGQVNLASQARSRRRAYLREGHEVVDAVEEKVTKNGW